MFYFPMDDTMDCMNQLLHASYMVLQTAEESLSIAQEFTPGALQVAMSAGCPSQDKTTIWILSRSRGFITAVYSK